MSNHSARECSIARFWAKVDKNGPIHPKLKTRCWTWTAFCDDKGYGSTDLASVSSRRVHRIAYELAKGAIPAGLVLDHLCRNRSCCNPEHLEPVTNVENLRRGFGVPAINARKTHCLKGHVLKEQKRKDGRPRRYCRICANERMRSLREQQLRGLRPVGKCATCKLADKKPGQAYCSACHVKANQRGGE